MRKYNSILFLPVILLLVSGSCKDDKEKESFNDLYLDYLSDTSLIAYFPFNNTLDDLSNCQIKGDSKGATFTNDRFNNINNSLMFDGIDDIVAFGDTLDTYFTGQDKTFSISFWIYPTEYNLGKIIISKSSDSNCDADERQFFIRIANDTTIRFVINHQLTYSHGWRVISGDTKINRLNQWYNVIVTYDGNIDTNNGLDRIQIFINGKQNNCNLIDYHWGLGDIENGNAQLGLGNQINSNGENCGDFNYSGKIDDLQIFNRILEIEDINTISTFIL